MSIPKAERLHIAAAGFYRLDVLSVAKPTLLSTEGNLTERMDWTEIDTK